VGVIEELPGKEPSAGEIADLVELIAEQGVKVVFAEPQFSPRAAEAIAEESGGEVKVMVLDPLGDPEDPEWDTYMKMMRKDVGIMEEAMR
jgi:zinc transport system substrate-binding protein